jgi:tetratricopeptide (TPR) repeat protein
LSSDRPQIELVERGPGPERTHALEPGAHRIGRLSACDVVLDDPSVSRIHARLEFEPARRCARIHDADSENGLEVTGRRVQWADLRPGDHVRVGEVDLEVRFEVDATWPAPARGVAPAGPLPGSVRLGALALVASALLLAFAWWSGARRTAAPSAAVERGSPAVEPRTPDAPPVQDPRAPTATLAVDPRFGVFDRASGVGTDVAPATSARAVERPSRRVARGGASPPPRSAVDERTAERLRRAHPSDPARVRALARYVVGDFEGARAAAQRVLTTDPAALATAVTELARAQARVRTEVSNDPRRAHALLDALLAREAQLLPDGVRAYVTRDLLGALVEAYARLGAARLDARRWEAAFAAWSRGLALDPEHPRLRAGMAQLRRRAAALAERAELSGQRGDRRACDQWRRVARITPPDADLHRRAQRRIEAWCR